MKDFSYHKPSSVSEAVALLAASGENRPLSGGMTLLPTMKQRLASPSALIDLTALSGLSGIAIEGGNVTIGAMTTHAEVAGSAALKATIPALATLAGLIGDPQVRHRGTIGCSLSGSRRGRLCEVQEPSIAFCAGRRACGKVRWQRACRRHRRRARGVPIQGYRGRAGGGLLARGADADFDCAVRPQLRHPCRQ